MQNWEHRGWRGEEPYKAGGTLGGWGKETVRSASPKCYFLQDLVPLTPGNPASQPLSTMWSVPFPQRSEHCCLTVSSESKGVSPVVPSHPHPVSLPSEQRWPSLRGSLSISQSPIPTLPSYRYLRPDLPRSYVVRSRGCIFLSTLPRLFFQIYWGIYKKNCTWLMHTSWYTYIRVIITTIQVINITIFSKSFPVFLCAVLFLW